MMTDQKKLTYRAGLIPYYITPETGQLFMMFMRPSNVEFGGDRWQIAKGRVEEGESPLETAIRETQEELGLFKGNILKTEEVGNFMGRTTIFVSKIKDKELFGEPSFESDAVKWMTPEEFQLNGRDLHKPVVKAAVRKISKMEDRDYDDA